MCTTEFININIRDFMYFQPKLILIARIFKSLPTLNSSMEDSCCACFALRRPEEKKIRYQQVFAVTLIVI